ncbi:MAG: nucleotidyltransferase domain-containing protein, partial [Candidatus Hydrogenedentota bacterium]
MNLLEKYINAWEKIETLILKQYQDRLITLALFGSFARKEIHENSDIDIFMVVDPLPKLRFKRYEEFSELIDAPLQKEPWVPPLSPILKTKVEALQKPWYYLDLATESVLIVDKDNFFQNVLKEVREKMNQWGTRKIG